MLWTSGPERRSLADQPSWPTSILAGSDFTYVSGPKVPGIGDGSVNGETILWPLTHVNRPGLLLLNGVVYTARGSHGDHFPAHGWLLGHDAATLALVSVFNATPDGTLGSIWMSGAAPGADAQGNIYLSTGNGSFAPPSGTAGAFGNSVLKFSTGGGLNLSQSFTPWTRTRSIPATWTSVRAEWCFSDQPGPHPHLIVAPTKTGGACTSSIGMTPAPISGAGRVRRRCPVPAGRCPWLDVRHSGVFQWVPVPPGHRRRVEGVPALEWCALHNACSQSTSTIGFPGAVPASFSLTNTAFRWARCRAVSPPPGRRSVWRRRAGRLDPLGDGGSEPQVGRRRANQRRRGGGSRALLIYDDDLRPLSWTGGTPTASSSNNPSGLYIRGR